MAIALRSRLNPSSISSRYGSQALTDRLLCLFTAASGVDAPVSLVSSAGLAPSESVVTSLAGFAGSRPERDSPDSGFGGSESVVTSLLAGFAKSGSAIAAAAVL